MTTVVSWFKYILNLAHFLEVLDIKMISMLIIALKAYNKRITALNGLGERYSTTSNAVYSNNNDTYS